MASKKTRGFKAPCIRCGEENVHVSLADVGQFFCAECNEEFTADDVRALLGTWDRVLAFLDQVPVVE